MIQAQRKNTILSQTKCIFILVYFFSQRTKTSHLLYPRNIQQLLAIEFVFIKTCIIKVPIQFSRLTVQSVKPQTSKLHSKHRTLKTPRSTLRISFTAFCGTSLSHGYLRSHFPYPQGICCTFRQWLAYSTPRQLWVGRFLLGTRQYFLENKNQY